MATLDIPDDDAPLRPELPGSSPPSFGANSPRVRNRRKGAEENAAPARSSDMPEIKGSHIFSAPLPPSMMAAAMGGSALIQRRVARLDAGLDRWSAMARPVVTATWPTEMFGRYPAQGEISRRWMDTFRGLNLQSLTISFDEESPTPWRVRRTPQSDQPRAFYELLLPQLGNYLNAGFDANPPVDCGKWHSDVIAFCISVMLQIYCEGVMVTIVTNGAVDVEGGSPR